MSLEEMGANLSALRVPAWSLVCQAAAGLSIPSAIRLYDPLAALLLSLCGALSALLALPSSLCLKRRALRSPLRLLVHLPLPVSLAALAIIAQHNSRSRLALSLQCSTASFLAQAVVLFGEAFRVGLGLVLCQAAWLLVDATLLASTRPQQAVQAFSSQQGDDSNATRQNLFLQKNPHGLGEIALQEEAMHELVLAKVYEAGQLGIEQRSDACQEADEQSVEGRESEGELQGGAEEGGSECQAEIEEGGEEDAQESGADE